MISERYTRLDRYDKCPDGKDLMPGSPTCQKCNFFIEYDREDEIYKCGWEDEILKLWRDNYERLSKEKNN